MTTVVEPSTLDDGQPMVSAIPADRLEKGMIVTNLGVVDGIRSFGVFVSVAIRGTVWSTTTGLGDIHVLDVVWHQANLVTVDTL